MTCWLYQMSANRYSHRRYCIEVWEGDLVTNWGIGESKRKPTEVQPGDTLILFFAKTGADEPGIYGWGVVTFFDNGENEMHFRPSTPSDYLKMNPLWDDEISQIIDHVRGGMPQGTIWIMDNKSLKRIREKIGEHLYSVIT